MTEVKQTVKHFDEQVNTRNEVQTLQTENMSNADNNTVQQNHQEWYNTLILGKLNNVWTYREKVVQK